MPRWAGWVAWCLVLASGRGASAQEAHLRMQRAVRAFVAETGCEVIGLGSWISGAGYVAGRSDQDLRLLLPPGTPDAAQRWRDARSALSRAIQAEFGDDAASILSKTNLYPPNHLMAFVEETGEALERYQQLKAFPCLGAQGDPAAAIERELAEGLYGEGSAAFVQFYEQTKGRLFYRDPSGRVVAGMCDLTHLAEGGRQAFTVAGTANCARGWVEHAAAEMAAGRGDKVAKYLDRLRRDLVKARQLAGLETGTALLEQIEAASSALKAGPGRLGAMGDDLAKLLARADVEASVIRGYGHAGPLGRLWQRLLVDSMEAGSRLGDLMLEVRQTVGRVTLDQAMMGLCACLALRATAQAAGEGGFVAALRTGGPQVVQLVGWLGTGVLLELTNEILKEAEAAGYELCANSQEAWDLMAGVYTALGRDADEPDKRRCYTLDQLVQTYHNEQRLEALVFGQARRAASRGLGGVTVEVDEKVAEAIFSKCWPVIRDAWTWQRDAMVGEYLQLAYEVRTAPFRITWRPSPAEYVDRPVELVVSADAADGTVWRKVSRMRELLRGLCGSRTAVAVEYQWTPAGREDPTIERWQRRFTFEKPGTYPVQVRIAIKAHSADYEPPEAHRILAERETFAAADLEVVPGKPLAGWRYSFKNVRDPWKPIQADSPSTGTPYADQIRALLRRFPTAAALESVNEFDMTNLGHNCKARVSMWAFAGPEPWFREDDMAVERRWPLEFTVGGKKLPVTYYSESRMVRPREAPPNMNPRHLANADEIAPYVVIRRLAAYGNEPALPLAVNCVLAIDILPHAMSIGDDGWPRGTSYAGAWENHLGLMLENGVCEKAGQ